MPKKYRTKYSSSFESRQKMGISSKQKSVSHDFTCIIIEKLGAIEFQWNITSLCYTIVEDYWMCMTWWATHITPMHRIILVLFCVWHNQYSCYYDNVLTRLSHDPTEWSLVWPSIALYHVWYISILADITCFAQIFVFDVKFSSNL